jgi:hypothetical protein
MSTFIETAYLNSMLQIEYELQNSLQEYLRISSRRAELGDGSGLVVRQIQQIAINSQIEIDRLTGQKEASKQSLIQWSGRTNLEVVDLSSLSLEVPPYIIENQPSVNSLIIEQSLIEKQRDLILSQSSPQIFTGLRLQRLGGSFLFFGLEAGVGIPFNKSYKEKQTQAFNLEAIAKNEQILFYKEVIGVDWQKKQNEAETAQAAADQLLTQVTAQKDLLDDLFKAFGLGEIPYSELILGYQNYSSLKRNYLEKLKTHYLIINELIHYVY